MDKKEINIRERIGRMIVSKDFQEPLVKYCPNKDLRDELQQEMALIIYNMEDDKLNQIVQSKNGNGLKYFWIALLRNNIISNSSNFHKKFRKWDKLKTDLGVNLNMENDNILEVLFLNTIEDESDSNYKLLREDKLNFIEQNLNQLEKENMGWVRDVRLFRMYYYGNVSFNNLSEITHIPVSNLWHYVKNVRDELKRRMKNLNLENN